MGDDAAPCWHLTFFCTPSSSCKMLPPEVCVLSVRWSRRAGQGRLGARSQELWGLHPVRDLSLLSPVPLSTLSLLLALTFLSSTCDHWVTVCPCNPIILSLSCGDRGRVLGAVNPFPQGCEEQTAYREGCPGGCGHCLSPALPTAFAMIPGGPGLSLAYDTRHTGGGPRTSTWLLCWLPPYS